MMNLSGTVKAVEGKHEIRIALANGTWHLKIVDHMSNRPLHSANSFKTVDEASTAAEQWLDAQATAKRDQSTKL